MEESRCTFALYQSPFAAWQPTRSSLEEIKEAARKPDKICNINLPGRLSSKAKLPNCQSCYRTDAGRSACPVHRNPQRCTGWCRRWLLRGNCGEQACQPLRLPTSQAFRYRKRENRPQRSRQGQHPCGPQTHTTYVLLLWCYDPV